MKLLFKGKQLPRGVPLSATSLSGAAAPKVMVMGSAGAAVAEVQAAKSDATVRGFASEDADALVREQKKIERRNFYPKQVLLSFDLFSLISLHFL